MEVVVTPRFHKIGESRKNLKLLKEKSKKRRHSVEYVTNIKKFKNKSKKKAKNSEKIKKIKKIRINDVKSTNSIFFHKFILRNDFDQDHCIKFLKEKNVYMEKPKFFDEICN